MSKINPVGKQAVNKITSLSPVIWKSKANGKWYVKLVGNNGEKVWANPQGYQRVAGATKSIKLLSKIKLPPIIKP